MGLNGTVKKHGAKGPDMTRFLLVLLIIIAMISVLPMLSAENYVTATRAANDVGVQSTTLIDQTKYPFSLLSFSVTVENNDDTTLQSFDVGCTAERLGFGGFEPVTGNTTVDVAASATTDVNFQFTPGFESIYEIVAKVNLVGDSDSSNDELKVTISIIDQVDANITIMSHEDGVMYPDTAQVITARVANSGTQTITDAATVNLTISNATAEVFYDEVAVGAAALANPGDSTNVDFSSWTPPNLEVYTIRTSIDMASDEDGGNDIHSIDVTIASAATPAVEVTALEPVEQLIPPGHSTKEAGYETYQFTIKNIGLIEDTYDWYAYSGHGWIDGNNPTTGTTTLMQPGDEFGPILIDIKVPIGAAMGQPDRLNLTAVSQANTSVKSTAVVNTVTQEIYNVEVQDPASQWGIPGGEPLVYTFFIKNTGNVPEKFNVAIAGVQPGWRAELLSPAQGVTPYLAPGEGYPAVVFVFVPELNYDTRIEDHTFYGGDGYCTVEAWSSTTGVTDSGTAITYVELIYTVEMDVEPDIHYVQRDINKSQPVTFDISVRNICNYRDKVPEGRSIINFTVAGDTPKFVTQWGKNHTDEAMRYAANVNVLNITLDVGETDDALQLRVTVPHDPLSGTCTVNVTARSTGDGNGTGIEIPATASTRTVVNQSAGVVVIASTDEENPAYDNNTNGVPDWREGAPLDTLNLMFNVSNHGNGEDRYNLSVWVEPFGNDSVSEDWEPEMFGYKNQTKFLKPLIFNITECYDKVYANVTIPSGTSIGAYGWVYLRATSRTDGSIWSEDKIRISVIEGHAVDLEPEENTSRVYPDDYIVFQINVTNAGNGVDTIDLSLSYPMLLGWNVFLDYNYLLLGKGETRVVNLTINASSEADADMEFKVKVTGRSQEDPTKFDEVNCTAIVEQSVGVDVDILQPRMQGGKPGDTLYYMFTIENLGNGNDTFNINFTTYPYENWTVKSKFPGETGFGLGESRSATLRAFETIVINVSVTIPNLPEWPVKQDLEADGLLAYQNNTVIVEATSLKDVNATNSEYGSIIVNPKTRIVVSTTDGIDNHQQVIPGSTVTYPLMVRNAGNVEDNADLFVEGDERYLRWANLQGISHSLGIGEQSTAELTVTPAINDMPYWHEQAPLNVKARSSDNVIHLSSTIYTKIVMVYVEDRLLEVDLGQEIVVPVLIMNVPKQGEASGVGAAYPATITVEADPQPGTLYQGWRLDFSTTTNGSAVSGEGH